MQHSNLAISKLLLLIGLTFFGCQKKHPYENFGHLKAYEQADNRLWPYFATFEQEAANRGIDIDLSSLYLRGVIQFIPSTSIVGVCGQSNRLITIDEAFWLRASSLQRELIVFHELGHCVLNKDHNENSKNGYCSSIMRSGVGGCLDHYTLRTRERMLDELFSIH